MHSVILLEVDDDVAVVIFESGLNVEHLYPATDLLVDCLNTLHLVLAIARDLELKLQAIDHQAKYLSREFFDFFVMSRSDCEPFECVVYHHELFLHRLLHSLEGTLSRSSF